MDGMWDHAGVLVSGCSLLLTMLTGWVMLLLRQSVLMMRNEQGQLEIRLKEAIAHERSEIDERIERHSREVGEMGSALRTKIQQVELWGRDNFVRRDSFEKTVDMIVASVIALGEKIDVRLERMEGKIDDAKTVAARSG